MLYPKNESPKLSPSLFEKPTSEYRCTPFWAWNCELDGAELLRQIDVMKEMGMGGFHMHTRVGMSTTYLSDEYMRFIKACNEKAKKEGMLSWLYDEDKWPSGFGGGYVTKKKENRQKFLLFTAKPYEANATAKEQLDSAASAARANNGYLLARYDILLDADGYLASYRRLDEGEAATGVVWYAYLETQAEGPWFNFETYVDTLSKPAIDDFIKVTHERYREVLGEEFGKSVPAIFTDEPQVTHKTVLNHSDGKEDVILPFTTDFDDTYRKAYGESFLDKLPEVIFETRDGDHETRYRYHDHTCERFVSAFCDNIGAWCRDNGIMLTGHMMSEPTLDSQTRALGEAMRCYRGFDLPGIDLLCDRREFTTLKQTASAAHQYGYEGVLSELYGVTNWDFDFRGHKLQGDWQAALGVSVRVPHLYWVSMKGEAKRDYPASIGHQSSWYKEYSYIEDHFARVNTVMTRGTADIKIGVIHPIESYWLHYGPTDKTGALRNELDRRFSEITDWLLYGMLDFDYISESLLPALYTESETGFAVGKMNYDVILIPACETLRKTTVDALTAFLKRGGKVILMGDAPTLMDAKPSKKPAALAKLCERIGWDKSSLYRALAPYRTIEVRNADGSLAGNLLYGARLDGDGKNLFLCHANGTSRRRVDTKESYVITLKGEFSPTLLDTENGTMKKLPAEYIGGDTVLRWDCYAQSSLLLRLDAGRTELAPVPADTEAYTEAYLDGECELILHEPNVCVLDMARWRVNSEPWQEREEMLRICDKAKKSLGLSTAATHGAQPWVMEKEIFKNTLSLEIRFRSDVKIKDVFLAPEDFEESRLIYNGKPVKMRAAGTYVDNAITKVCLGTVKKGENVILVTRPIGAVSNVENMFLLGDFGVSVTGADVVLTAPPKTVRFGDITRQGLPFYGGALTYRTRLSGGCEARLSLGLFAAPCVTVRVDGGAAQNVSLAPYTAELGRLSAGEHTLEITAYQSRINTFGTLHLSDYTRTWIGPVAWHSVGGDFSYEYRITESGILTAPRILKKEI